MISFINKCIVVVLLIGASVSLYAQSDVQDGFYERKLYKGKGIIKYEFVREADVFFERRVWRVIDVREKMNMHFAYPKEPIIQLILDATESGEATAYNAIDDEFTTPMTPDEVKTIGRGFDTVLQVDPITFEEKTVVTEIELDLTTIKKFRLKEDWYFDKETSTMQVRIIGIAPIRDRYDENGNFLGPEPMFWIYYPNMRQIFANHEVFNIKNDAQRLTWYNIFEMRYFSSYIIKESNVQDRRIQDYATGIDMLLEGERVHHDLFIFEHDLWSW